MKKIILIFIIAVTAIISFSNVNINIKEKNSISLDIQNVEALAQEIWVGPLCRHSSSDLCWIDFSDGYFLTGIKQYG